MAQVPGSCTHVGDQKEAADRRLRPGQAPAIGTTQAVINSEGNDLWVYLWELDMEQAPLSLVLLLKILGKFKVMKEIK